MRITKKRLRAATAILVFASGAFTANVLRAESAADPKRILATVDYIGRDYEMAVAKEGGLVLSEAEYREMKDLAAWAVLSAETLGGDGGVVVAAMGKSLEDAVREKRPVTEIRENAAKMRREILQRFQIATAPPVPPDLQKGKRLYEQSCWVCHGSDGRADTPTAKQLNPPPAALATAKILDRLSPFQAFNTVTFGREGTAMPAFETFSEEDRWAVASYLFLLREGLPPEGPEKAIVGWREALARTDGEILEGLKREGVEGNQALASLGQIRRLAGAEGRAGEASLDTSLAARHLRTAMETLMKSRMAYEGKDGAAALDLAISAYLDGFEPVESLLNSLGRSDLRLRVEEAFVDYRTALRGGQGVLPSYESLEMALGETRGVLNESKALSPGLVFLASLSIVAREGIEAILLLAVLLSVLRTGGLPRYRAAVHGGWLSALAAGFLSWLILHDLVTGRFREGIEGWISLVAALVLIYVSFWLIARRDAERWKNYLMGRIRGAGRWGMWTVAGIAFLAVYRELFESILFLEALRMQAPAHWPSLVSGAVGGAILLSAVVWLIFRLGKFIPLGIFFGLSGGLLYLLGVVFVGQGIHSLQEAAILPLTPFSFISVPALGIFPTLEGAVAQGALVLLFVASLLWQQLVKTPREESALQREVSHASTDLLGIHELGEHLLEHLRDLRGKVGQGRASEGVMKEIIGHMEDLDREIHQLILRLAQIYEEIPRRFLEVYQGVEELERSAEKERLLERTNALRAHLESLK